MQRGQDGGDYGVGVVVVARPAGSTATLSATGKGTANRTTVTVDKAWVYVVRLVVWAGSELGSQPTNFSVTAQ